MDRTEIANRMVRRFGPQVADWCAGVPSLARQAASRWGLTIGAVYPDGGSSIAIRCTSPDGTPAVLKLSPDKTFLAKQTAMLRLFAPSGRVPALLATDLPAGLIVLEAIEPGVTARDLPHPPSPSAWSDLLRALHAAAAPLSAFRDLRDWCDEFFTRLGGRLDESTVGEHVRRADLYRAKLRCDTLLDSQATRVLLHGDLHLRNVLDGGPRGLVAIDPKACLGDPCFDAIDYVLDGARWEGIDARSQAVAAAYGLDADRLHAWCRATAPLVAITWLAGGHTEPAVTELLKLVR